MEGNVLCDFYRVWTSWRDPGGWAQIWWVRLTPKGQRQLMGASFSSHPSVMDPSTSPNQMTVSVPLAVSRSLWPWGPWELCGINQIMFLF